MASICQTACVCCARPWRSRSGWALGADASPAWANQRRMVRSAARGTAKHSAKATRMRPAPQVGWCCRHRSAAWRKGSCAAAREQPQAA